MIQGAENQGQEKQMRIRERGNVILETYDNARKNFSGRKEVGDS